MFFPFKINLKNSTPGIALVAFLFLLVFMVMSPIFTIWALNLLFKTEIPVNFWTWLSVAWITGILCRTSSNNN